MREELEQLKDSVIQLHKSIALLALKNMQRMQRIKNLQNDLMLTNIIFGLFILALIIYTCFLKNSISGLRFDVDDLKAKETRREILWKPYGIHPAEYHLNEMETKNEEENQ